MKALIALGALTALTLATLGLERGALAAPKSPSSSKSPADAAAKPAEKPAARAAAKPAARSPHGKTAHVAKKAAPERASEERSAAKIMAPASRSSKDKPKAPCFHDPVTVMHFAEEDTFPLTQCDGSVAHLAVERLSVLARPGNAPKPQTGPADLAKVKGDRLAPGIRRVDPRLVARIQTIVDHFSKGKHARLQLISGYRPGTSGSYHKTGRALDMRIDGVSNEALIAFCKSLPDTGCGYYPNSSFIHVDVREPGTGHVAWIDASGPGESPRYVSAWPPPPSGAPNSAGSAGSADGATTVEEALAKLEKLLPPLPADEHVGHDDSKEPADPAQALPNFRERGREREGEREEKE